MSKGATSEEKLGELHNTIYTKYNYLCSDPKDDTGKPLLAKRELLTALSGGAKFLNDNNINAERYVSDTSELEKKLKKKSKRSFGQIIEMKAEAVGE